MPANADRNLLTQPATVPGAINRRLRWAREDSGLSQRAWRTKLLDRGYDISAASVSDYEVWMPRTGKQIKLPPVDYLTRVCLVLGYRLEWLASGSGEAKPDAEEQGGNEEPDKLFESQRFGALASRLGEVHWARGSARPALLRLLSEAQHITDGTPTAQSIDHLVHYLDDLVPPESASFLSMLELPPREREHVALHVRGLVYLLFRPFRDADFSYVWSKVLGRSRSEAGRPTQATVKPPARRKGRKGTNKRRGRD